MTHRVSVTWCGAIALLFTAVGCRTMGAAKSSASTSGFEPDDFEIAAPVETPADTARDDPNAAILTVSSAFTGASRKRARKRGEGTSVGRARASDRGGAAASASRVATVCADRGGSRNDAVRVAKVDGGSIAFPSA